MKKIILFLLAIIWYFHSFPQLTLEHTYDDAGYYFSSSKPSSFYIVNLEVDGEKYVNVDRTTKQVKFYNLNHTVWKTISFTGGTDLNAAVNVMSILYISQHLFDTDDEIEFLYVDVNMNDAVTQVINEDGSILFTANNEAPLVLGNVPQAQLPIYNTVLGAKMILSVNDGRVRVYSLGGTLTAGIIGNPDNQFENFKTSLPYPNPSRSSTRIDFTLPKGIDTGQLVFYNMQGKEIKRFNVDKTFDSLLISTEDLQSGTYYFNLQTSLGNSETKKLVNIK